MIDPASLDLTSVVRRSNAVVAAELDGDTVLYHDQLGTVNVLDPIATAIWRELDGDRVAEDIATHLATMYDTDTEQVGADVVTAIRALGRLGLLDGVASDPATIASHELDIPDHLDDR